MSNFRSILAGYLFGIACLLTACGAYTKCPAVANDNTIIKKTERSGRIWVPEYYVYKSGRYKFISGHYRPILSKQYYWKKSLRGYTSKQEFTAAR